MGDEGIERNVVLENYINDLISKGYKKKDIKKKLLNGGYDSILTNKYLYPYTSVLLIAGIILVLMIIIFISVAAYFVVVDGGRVSIDVSKEPDWSDVGRCWEDGVEVACENLDTLEQDYEFCDKQSGDERDECILDLASGGFFKLCKEIKNKEMYNLCYARAFDKNGGLDGS